MNERILQYECRIAAMEITNKIMTDRLISFIEYQAAVKLRAYGTVGLIAFGIGLILGSAW